MLNSVHFLLTYTCLYECEHCFLYCSPKSEGTFTADQVEAALDQGLEAGITSIFVEGGEPFLFYPLLQDTLRMAKERDLKTSIVTNCYWARADRDVRLWLEPLVPVLDGISVSDDAFHFGEMSETPAQIAGRVAQELGISAGAICIDEPVVSPRSQYSEKDADGAVIGGDVLFKGRAVDALVKDLPRRPAKEFDSCPHEELAHPERIHLDPFGNVLVCQGIAIGNINGDSLKTIMSQYQPEQHPIVGPLLAGGPAELARVHACGTAMSGYVDHCHLCFEVRRQLRERFSESLCPAQVYGEQTSGPNGSD